MFGDRAENRDRTRDVDLLRTVVEYHAIDATFQQAHLIRQFSRRVNDIDFIAG